MEDITSPISVSSAAQAEQGLPSEGKRRKLDLVKCESCRNDKQKCLPINRKWPTKCNRCISKGFACSKGMRATWKRKRSQSTDSSHDRANQEWQSKWPIFLNFHKMMTMAILCLRHLKEEIGSTFGVTILQMTVAIDDPNECAEFEAFVSTLGQLILVRAKNFVATSQAATAALLASFMIDDYCVSSAVSRLCPICDFEDNALALLDTLDRNRDMDILARIARWSAHCRHLDHRPAESHAEAESLRIKDQLADFGYMIGEELDHLPDNLFTAGVPDSIEQFPAFVPEEFSLTPFGRLHASVKDCLGRNWLHQLFDIKVELLGPNPVERIRDILQQSDLKEMFLDHQDILGRSPLHIACTKGYKSAVSIMLLEDVDPDTKTIYGSTPMHYAAASGFVDICKLLLLKANINARDGFGATPLHYACTRKHKAIVELLLYDPLIDPNDCGPDGSVPLLIRYIKENEEHLVRLLIDSGADPNVTYQDTPAIYWAIELKNLMILRYLVESDRFMINAKSRIGNTALHFSAYHGFDDVVSYLSGRPSVDMNVVNKHGCTPLMQAARAGRTEIVEFLTNLPQVNLKARDEVGWTAEDIARSCNCIAIADLIVYKTLAREK